MQARAKAAALKRVTRVCLSLPEATVESATGQHHAFRVRGRTFAYFLDHHHGDGRVAITVKAAPGEQGRLVAAAPERFFVPAYLGARGWVGLRFDVGAVDWAETERLLRDSYAFTAPRRLAASAASSLPAR
jgi:phosphoribosylglycinamide formyltransferase-1